MQIYILNTHLPSIINSKAHLLADFFDNEFESFANCQVCPRRPLQLQKADLLQVMKRNDVFKAICLDDNETVINFLTVASYKATG